MALGKKSTVLKQERGAENCLLQVFFYLRDLNLASYARVIDSGAIDSHAHSTRSQVSRIVYSEWNVSSKRKFLQLIQL